MLAELALGLFLTPPAYLVGWGTVAAAKRLWRCGLLGFWMTESARQRAAARGPLEVRDALQAVVVEHAKRATAVEFGYARDRQWRTKCCQCGVQYISHPRGCPRCSPSRRIRCVDCGTGCSDSLKTFPEFDHRPVCFPCQVKRREHVTTPTVS